MQQRELEKQIKQDQKKTDGSYKSDNKTDLDFSDKWFLSGNSSEDSEKDQKKPESNEEKKPTDSDMETSKNIIKEITAMLSDDEVPKAKEKSPIKPVQQLTSVNGDDLKIGEHIFNYINIFYRT